MCMCLYGRVGGWSVCVVCRVVCVEVWHVCMNAGRYMVCVACCGAWSMYLVCVLPV